MTHKIPKSSLAPFPIPLDEAKGSFERLLHAYISELQTWHDHHVIVDSLTPMRPRPEWIDFAAQKDQAKTYLHENAKWHAEKLARHEPYPQPIAHADIVASVATKIGEDGKTTYVSDFEIVNDDPTPEQVLARKKDVLLQAVTRAEQEALMRVQLPIGKQRAANLLEADIRARDGQLANELAADAKAHPDIAAEIEKRRDPAHTQHLDDQESRRSQVDAILRAGAKAMSDVEDLTMDNIDAFEIPSFEN
jgi:hypothetical protein